MADIEQQQQYWRNVERERPTEIIVPGPGQESVWDYPRPPAVEPVASPLRVEYAGIVLAETTHGLRVAETSSPPAYYFPPADVRREFLQTMRHTTVCEWKGTATYYSVSIRGREQEAVAWTYDDPDSGYEALVHYFAFHAGRVDACFVGEERVTPQPGDYYGGWVTASLVGPFKGVAGSERW